MELSDQLSKERRARLAAERLLDQKSRELFAANEKLALHARALSEQIIEQRQVVKTVMSEAEELKDQNSRFLSDLERAHSAAIMAERRLWDSINTIRDGFAVFDADHRLVTANTAFCATFEYDHLVRGYTYDDFLNDIIRKNIVNITPLQPEIWCQNMRARWDNETLTPLVLQLTNGRWMRFVDHRTNSHDMVCLIVDITEQMRIWAAIEAIPDGFVLYDRDDRLIVCNQRYRDLYAPSAPAMLPGSRFEDILRYGLDHGQYPDAVADPESWFQERLQQRIKKNTTFSQQIAGDRWLQIIDKETPDGGRVGLRIDITKARQQQAALQAARDAAEAAVRAKSSFLANMSHEIRTPMNGVVGMAELLCDTKLTDEQRLFAETIKSSGEALLVIINDILDYSKLEADRLVLTAEPFDLERIIHEVCILLQPRATVKNIDILIDFDLLLPTHYIGDAGRLRQILTNLIGNAIKFTEKGHVLVQITGVKQPDHRHKLHITINDTGIGIAEEHLDHIFGEFNQVESDANRRYEGTGLGLPITQRLIHCMGGNLWVKSELGIGSCFGFDLTFPVTNHHEVTPVHITAKRLIVIDDLFPSRMILERQLNAVGIEVRLCRNCLEALDYLQNDPHFDAVIADHKLPETDGIAFACQLENANISIPVLLLSRNLASIDKSRIPALVQAVLQKPLLRKELYSRLQTIASCHTTIKHSEEKHQKLRVLAAEDNHTNQLVFQKMLHDLDVDLYFANNGREAIEIFKSHAPDMIFMDISMPEMDGKAAAIAIRTLEKEQNIPPTPIIALTALTMEQEAKSILACGINHYLPKPVRKKALYDVIEKYKHSHI